MADEDKAASSGKTRVTIWLSDATVVRLREQARLTGKTQAQLTEEALERLFETQRLDLLERRLADLERRLPPEE